MVGAVVAAGAQSAEVNRDYAVQRALEWARHPFHSPRANLPKAAFDTYVNAIHVSLLCEKQLNPTYATQLAGLGTGSDNVSALGEKLLAAGPDELTPSGCMSVMADQWVTVWLHQQAWLRLDEQLAPWWRAMIREFSRQEN